MEARETLNLIMFISIVRGSQSQMQTAAGITEGQQLSVLADKYIFI